MKPIIFYVDFLKDRVLRCKYKWQGRTTGAGSVILMFHHVAENCPEGVSPSCYSSIADFESLLTELAELKQFVSISELWEELKKGIVPNNKVVVTFDDVPENVYHNAIPILRALKIPYTLYVATSMIGVSGFMSKEQLIELSHDPLCTIGSHTITHCMLKYHEENMMREFADSKTFLENLIKRPVEHFAYPYGTPFAISKKTISSLRVSGLYLSAVCTIPAYINSHSIKDMYSLPRVHSQLYYNEFLNKKK